MQHCTFSQGNIKKKLRGIVALFIRENYSFQDKILKGMSIHILKIKRAGHVKIRNELYDGISKILHFAFDQYKFKG